jgi:hypothetical protein
LFIVFDVCVEPVKSSAWVLPTVVLGAPLFQLPAVLQLAFVPPPFQTIAWPRAVSAASPSNRAAPAIHG